MKDFLFSLSYLPPERKWHYLYLFSALGLINSFCLMIVLLSQPPFDSSPSGVWASVYACSCLTFTLSLSSLLFSTFKLSYPTK